MVDFENLPYDQCILEMIEVLHVLEDSANCFRHRGWAWAAGGAFPKSGVPLGGHYKKDYSTVGSILGSLILGYYQVPDMFACEVSSKAYGADGFQSSFQCLLPGWWPCQDGHWLFVSRRISGKV